MESKGSDSADQETNTELEKTLASLTIVDNSHLVKTEDTANTTPSSTEDTANTTPNSVDDDEEEDNDDPIDIDPVAWSPDFFNPEGDDTFTEEELINVLRSFEDDHEDNGGGNSSTDPEAEDNVVFPEGEALPELDFETGINDSLLLAPTEFTASIFDSSPSAEEASEETAASRNDTTRNSDDSDVSERNPLLTDPIIPRSEDWEKEPLDDEKKGDLEDDFALLEGLQKLNIALPEEEEQDYNYDIPPYFYCQPCTPGAADTTTANFSLASIAEDQELLDSSAARALRQIQSERPKLPEKEFDTLLQLSLLNVDDGQNPYLSEAEMDSLFEGGHAATDHDATLAQDSRVGGYHQQHQHGQQQQQDHEHVYAHEQEEQVFHVSQRLEALDCAAEIISNFIPNQKGQLANERSCIGHKETIFGAAISTCGMYVATASQDSTVRIWDAKTNNALSTLKGHSTDHECLRVAWATPDWASETIDRGKESGFSTLIATAGADGTVKVWATKDPSEKDTWACCTTLDHTNFERVSFNPEDEAEKPQVYAVQWIDHWSGLPVPGGKASKNSFLLTTSDDFVHLWELESKPEGDSKELKFKEVMSLNFVPFQNPAYGVSVCQVTNSGLGIQRAAEGKLKRSNDGSPAQKAFGGERNPSNLIFAFDAVYCDANGLLGVALSDGTLRLINGRGVCISIVQLPGCQSHLTSFSWDSTGTRLATSVATGHVILWGVLVSEDKGSLETTCKAILEGGHEPGRPVFGSKFMASGENLLLTWGVDGRLCLWDSFSQGNINAPIAVLLANPDYPIYAVDARPSYVVVGGGDSSEVSFMGVPVMMYDTQTTTSTASNE